MTAPAAAAASDASPVSTPPPPPATTPWINPSQTIFGLLWTIGFAAIMRDALGYSGASILAYGGINVGIGTLKAIFVLITPVYLVTLAQLLIILEATMLKVPDLQRPGTLHTDALRQERTMLRHSLAYLVAIWGFLLTTFFLFGGLNMYSLIFAAWFPLVWILYEMVRAYTAGRR